MCLADKFVPATKKKRLLVVNFITAVSRQCYAWGILQVRSAPCYIQAQPINGIKTVWQYPALPLKFIVCRVRNGAQGNYDVRLLTIQIFV